MTYLNTQGTNFESESSTQTGGVSPFAGPQGASSAFIEGGVGIAHATQLSDYKIIRRNGAVVAFEPSKIAIAVTKAFLAVNGGQGAASARVREQVEQLTQVVVKGLLRSRPNGGTFHIEDIQDQVELALMRSGEHNVARAYVLYRDKRNQERQQTIAPVSTAPVVAHPGINVTDKGVLKPLDMANLQGILDAACQDLGSHIVSTTILTDTIKNLYDGVPIEQVFDSAILAARTLIEKDPAYSLVTARILMHVIRRDILGVEIPQGGMQAVYSEYFSKFLRRGVKEELLDPKLLQIFDIPKLGAALNASRDLQFNYLGLQTLFDRYFLHVDGQRIEMPQAFFMRVSMGLALDEANPTDRAIEFYEILSKFDFMSSTPTLFNSASLRSQLSSCYLTTIPDDLEGIYEGLKENALLSKFAGGLGNDWTNVRSLGSHIKGTNGKSQGVVPFLKVVNDTAVAVNQGGKRKGAVCAYLETWHLDIEEFLELRKNTGDDRRRTHDMNTANWIPDLFMKRVIENKDWTLFTPSTTPDLHDKFGLAFEEAYVAYEKRADAGEIKPFKRIPALQLWRKMIAMLFETGHPWITFKDPCNVRNPQQHVGVVHSSNLCTEITLNTNESEIAVCNLGSVNLTAHMMTDANGKLVLDHAKLEKTINIAMRMLDNVIDINYYAVAKAKNSNMRHRPVGMGIMGFQDCLHMLRIPYASQEAVEFADTSMEAVCYYAYKASNELAKERGTYSTYKGSLWDRGLLPQDTNALLLKERGGYLEVDSSSKMDWSGLRASIAAHGMRNSNCIAIAPTATISNIIGVSACIEPTFQNLYVKSNLSGEFTVVNEYLVRDLKARGLWDEVMIADLKYFDGSLAKIDRIPNDLREIYATAFEVEPKWIVEAASRRQKWIDQAQSLNIYMAGASGKTLDDTYKLAWIRGLKTTYYLRTTSATQVEKSTVSKGTLNSVSNGSEEALAAAGNTPTATSSFAQGPIEADGPVCTMRPGDDGFEECEACQ